MMFLQNLLEALFFLDTHHVGVFEIVVATLVPFLLSLVVVHNYRSVYEKRPASSLLIRSVPAFAVFASLMMLLFRNDTARAIIILAMLHFIRPQRLSVRTRETGHLLWAILLGITCGMKYYLASIAVTFLLSASALLISMWAGRNRNDKRANEHKNSIPKTDDEILLLPDNASGE